ncbi:YheU family protein [Bdellovibrio bacteriovorus]
MASEKRIALTNFVEIPMTALSDSILSGFIESFVRHHYPSSSESILIQKAIEVRTEIQNKELLIYFDLSDDTVHLIRAAKAYKKAL